MDSQPITGQKTRRGFNLIESAIVLGVVGVIIGGIWVAAASFYESYKVNKTVGDIKIIFENTQKLISIADGSRIGTSVNILPFVTNAGVFPDDWVNNGTVVNPYGGSVHFYNYYHNAGLTNLEGFAFSVFAIPPKTCTQLVTRFSNIVVLTGGKENSSLEYNNRTIGHISVRGENQALAPWIAFYDFPVSIETAHAACERQEKMVVSFGVNYTRIN